MSDRVLVAPPGLTRPDQFAERNIQRMPTPPRPANNLVVGGPAYFTPEGYQAPVQPQEAFMPTRTGYDPIRDQFNRPPAPMPMPAPAPAPPVQAPPPTQTGGVGDPAPYVPAPAPAPAPQYDVSTDPMPDPVQSYIDVNGNLQFGEPPSFTMEPYSMEPEPVFEPTPTPAPEPVFTPPPTMPEPNGFFPNMNFEDLDLSGLPDLSKVPGLADLDFSGLPQYQMPAPPPSFQTQGTPIGEMPLTPEQLARKKRQEEEREAESIKNAIAKYGSVENRQKSVREALATPAPIYTPPPKMEEMFEDYDYGNPNLRDRGMFGPRR